MSKAQFLNRLVGVNEALRGVVMRASESCPFAVIEGVRTRERQEQLVAKGSSRTMNSRHLTGHAVDLAPLHAGRISWEWPHFSPLVAAMRQAAIDLNVPLIWGGCWDTELNSTTGDAIAIRDAYAARIRARGRRPFLDGPHFELNRSHFP